MRLPPVFVFALVQYRAEKGELPEAGDIEQAEEVFGLAKACNEEEGGFKADGLDDGKVRQGVRGDRVVLARAACCVCCVVDLS